MENSSLTSIFSHRFFSGATIFEIFGAEMSVQFLRPSDLSINKVIDLEGIGISPEEYCFERNEKIIANASTGYPVTIGAALYSSIALPIAAVCYFQMGWPAVFCPIGFLAVYFVAQLLTEKRRKVLRLQLNAFYEAQERADSPGSEASERDQSENLEKILHRVIIDRALEEKIRRGEAIIPTSTVSPGSDQSKD
jgi:hypothetical protein